MTVRALRQGAWQFFGVRKMRHGAALRHDGDVWERLQQKAQKLVPKHLSI